MVFEMTLFSLRSIAERHSVSELERLFVISESDDGIPCAWDQLQFESWYIFSHPSLPVTKITCDNEDIILVVLGDVFGLTMGVHPGSELRSKLESVSTFGELELALHTAGGRYVCVASIKRDKRIYLDAGGMLSLVFSAISRSVASNQFLIPRHEGIKPGSVV
ncbi:MAG: hypothetical protein Cons2KO_19270 [Congregibacter sp.]